MNRCSSAIFFFFFLLRSRYVALGSLRPLGSSDPPASASLEAEITDTHVNMQLHPSF
jgi:hypothetical protein